MESGGLELIGVVRSLWPEFSHDPQFPGTFTCLHILPVQRILHMVYRDVQTLKLGASGLDSQIRLG